MTQNFTVIGTRPMLAIVVANYLITEFDPMIKRI